MKILLIHNFMQSSAPSGEAVAFDNDRRLLEQAGHEVFTYTRSNDSITDSLYSRTSAAISLFWSRSAYRDIAALIRRHRPDVAHFHNTFPLLSVSGYRACRAQGVAVIQTLHNYRLVCPAGLLTRQGKPCFECIDGSLLNSVRHACYRQSHFASGLVATMLVMNRNRGIYEDDVDCYICLTESARERFIRGGLPESKLTVRPNVLADPPAVGRGAGGFALFVGRLTPEKGPQTRVTAGEGIDYPLRIVGDGLLRDQLQQQCLRTGTRATFDGVCSPDQVAELMREATFLVIPSECFEGFSVTHLEALACGTPMIVSAIGALDELMEAPANGLKFTAGDAKDLRRTALELLRNDSARASMRANNRALFERRYTPQRALEQIEGIYRRVIASTGPQAAAGATPPQQ